MRVYLNYAFFGFVVTLAASCTRTDPPNFGGADCSTDNDCKDPLQTVCDVGGENKCVQCIPDKREDVCTGTTPVCAADFSCQKCVMHSDCASNACMPDGSCVASADVVYLKAGGTGTTCTQDMACGSLVTAEDALNATRRTIRIVGNITSTGGDFDNGGKLVILGDNGGSTVTAGGGGIGILFDFSNNSRAEIYDLVVKDAREQGIAVSPTSELLFVRSRVENAGREGIQAYNNGLPAGKVTMLQSEVVSCNDTGRRGVSIGFGGELIMDRSRVAENEGGGIQLFSGAKFIVTNSFIVANKAMGGLSAIMPANDSKLEFSTIVDNAGPGGAGAYGGVQCDDNVNAVVRHNIIYRNTSGGGGGTTQRFGDCSFVNNFEMGVPPNDTSLKFKSETAPKDYHLSGESPAMVRNVTGVVCTGLKDFDNDSRPLGGGCDLGADEVQE